MLGLAWLITGCDSGPKFCTEHYSNGQVKYSVQCDPATGDYMGLMKEYHRNGELWKTRYFDEGKENDTTYFFYSKTGDIFRKLPMQNGEKHGLAQSFHPDGTLKQSGRYQFNRKEGEHISFYSNGEMESRIVFEGGTEVGVRTDFFKNGAVKFRGEFKDGERHGVWKYYDRSGNSLAEFTFRNGQRMGPFSIFRPNGKMYLMGSYTLGMIDSELHYFTVNGSKFATEDWRMGENQDYDAIKGLKQSYEEDFQKFYVHLDKVFISVKGDDIKIK
ncbi:hypothetical protein [Pontibacter sp. G13]|uniref:toxin-antitoxin system YwqK family antitoxin n=1 Tax=Pontibacter sp. G13 TaxID=3074898 RepID=UPI00288C091C|nr:hypothetical protein [Pontibacter sp. G13]WNJ18084.1 hypothetical protein RJD25_24775 [Pontibacter sp. G13]